MSNTFELLRIARAVLEKLGLSEGLGAELKVSPVIALTLPINELVNETRGANVNANISASAVIILTVPDGHRYHIIYVNKPATTNATGVFPTLRGVAAGYYQVTTGARSDFTPGLVLSAGDRLTLTQGNALDASVPVEVGYWDEVLSITRQQA